MSQIDELQRRINAALDRIGQGVEAYQAPAQAADPQEIETLKQALDDERTANAQLEERVKSIKSKHAGQVETLEKQAADQKTAMAELDGELQRLRAANDQLLENNRALREANEAGVGEPHLINKAMMAELEALRAGRAADAAEAGAIVAALEPLVNGGDA